MQNGSQKQCKTSPSLSDLREREAIVIKRLLKRRQNARLASLFDEAIPSCYLKQSTASVSPILHVTQGQHLSPYVIHLESSCAHSTESEELTDSILINLLTHPIATPAFTPSYEDNLALTSQDTQNLFSEQQINNTLWGKTFTSPTPKPCFSKQFLRAQGYIPATLQTPFANLETFEHPKPPQDIFSYFDLPDTEEEENESELVELVSLQQGVQEIPSPTEDLIQNLPIAFPRLSRRTFSLPWIKLPQGWVRAMTAFLLVSFATVLPIHAMSVVKEIQETKTQILSLGTQGLSSFTQGTQAAFNLDVKTAERSFSKAVSRFDEAQTSLQNLGVGVELLSAIPTTQAHTASTLLEAAKHLSYAGLRLSQGWSSLESSWQTDLTTRLAMLATHLQTVLPYVTEAETLLTSVDPNYLTQEQKNFLSQATTQLPALQNSLRTFLALNDFAQQALGTHGSKQYLLLFQNQTELRPTGGFVGSYAEIKVHKGAIENLSIPGGGSYALQGQMRTSFVAPEPLRLLTARWEFQDANWFADFPTSSRNTLAMYEEAGGPTVDGVIAINASFLETLLGILGPVDMPDYGRTITQENFLLETQKIVEYEYDKTVNQPKAFIGDLSVALLDRLTSLAPMEYLSVIQTVQIGLASKDIQVYFTNENLQKQAITYGWSGEIKQPSGDYLMVVDTNLGGGKTDAVIKEVVDVTVQVAQNGTLTNTVTITRTHEGTPGTLFTGINNVDYLRLYVPKGSTLLHASGFSIPDDRLFEVPQEDWVINEYLAYVEDTLQTDPLSRTDISEESGKTVFGNWVQTPPGFTSTVQFTYRLPFTLSDVSPASLGSRVKTFLGMSQTANYTLYIQKQSGVLNRNTYVHVELPENMQTLWSSVQTDETPLTNSIDQTFALLVEHNQ